ncbi:hypothetical protein G3I40_30570 [Streptomyces sp. SID14478]|uniref:hypothetical protein n=1 Tax=Streptomyces sp. SID14478 TaxID=2706073 RepID=UPI0013DBD8B7|nr:hypothetical protein [Streptomyces sp. SID14478]NEB79530.1 hypothetical protein [Streptomyces sp. SID14478]
MATYSISIRLQRTSVEERYVSVPVTDAVMRTEPNADGTYGLDTEKLLAAAIELGQDDADWSSEAREVTIHPIQKAPDDVQTGLDAAQDAS